MDPARRSFAARHTEFDAIRVFVEAACMRLREDERQRVVLLVEELFANSVNHGYGGDSDQPVWITVRVGDEGCELVYEDCAPAYDPFSATPKRVDGHADERAIGGLGLVLLTELSSSRVYRRRGNRNVIELKVRRSLQH